MRRLLSIFSMAVLLVGLAATGASAAPTFVIPVDTVIRAPAGSFTVLADVETPPELIGSTCIGIAAAENQESVHPNNDIIIETGVNETILPDVEGSSDKVTEAVGTITLGPRVKLTLHMGGDGVFSGGLVVIIDVNCTPPTTVPPTTVPPTTVPPTTAPPTTIPPSPAIDIVKTADPENYVGDIGEFTINVTNPGPVDLHDVHVTDEYALGIDPGSDCPHTIGDLAVNQTLTYSCTISGLDGVSLYDNFATAIGTGPGGTEVTATDNAQIFPIMGVTLTTQAPATTEAPGETLPVTGISDGQTRGFGAAGLILVLSGIVILGGATLIGQHRSDVGTRN